MKKISITKDKTSCPQATFLMLLYSTALLDGCIIIVIGLLIIVVHMHPFIISHAT